ncbi:MAG TPA: PilZ domain-containing protein [Polyangiaceae bacterium]
MSDRRKHPRKQVDLFFNKFLDGHPYLCRAIDLSEKGLLAVTYSEPEVAAGSFPLELRLPGQKRSLWVWARTVRRTAKQHAIEFLRLDPRDRRDLDYHLSAQPTW